MDRSYQEILNVPKNTVLREPIYLGLKNKVILEENSEAVVVDHHSLSIHTEAQLGWNARLTFIKVLEKSSTPCESLFVSEQSAGSVLKSQIFDLGSGTSRNEIRASLKGEGAECILDGLYILGDQQSSSHNTCIDHVFPRAMSEEFYKGILAGRAQGDFQGKIIVRPQAQKTVARQMNKNLLLSKEAVIQTKPLLEIFANDVKCNHGAAIGRLDEQALFYLRARGISETDAKQMLTYAYVAEMVVRVQDLNLREWIHARVKSRLEDIHAFQEAA